MTPSLPWLPRLPGLGAAMFFKTFRPMEADEILSKINGQRKAALEEGPGPELGTSSLLEGMHFSFKGDGEFAPAQLEYSFSEDLRLTLIENGTTYEDVPFNALDLGENLILLSHLIPGTSRGWHIAADLESFQATVFETWFGITVPVGGTLSGERPPTHHREIPREVQRHYHFGYLDSGQEPPTGRHHCTNRIEGRGLHWESNGGRRWLSYFPSVACSLSVLLDEPEDTIMLSYPSDFIRISERYYIYAKWGVEFGGEMQLHILDFFDMEGIGLNFGFDVNDEFLYRFYRVSLSHTGDAAHLEKINFAGDPETPMALLRSRGKGARYAYRPRDIDVPMNRAEVEEAVKKRSIFEPGGSEIMMGANSLPHNYDLVDWPFSLRYDVVQTPYPWSEGNIPAKLIKHYEYNFTGKETLKWREAGGTWHEEKYVCFNPAKDIYFFSHMLSGDPDYACAAQAIDISTGLATCVYARIGSWRSEWEASATCLFGTAQGEGFAAPPFSRRHGFTQDMLGQSYAWNYSETSSSIHVYGAPYSYSWTIFQQDNSGGASWSSPGFFIKLREDAYMLQWVEETCNGSQGLAVFNPRIMQDSGFFYGVTRHGGLSLNFFGAQARKLGAFDVKKYFK